MSSIKKQPPRFHVGDWVAFEYGPRKVTAKVIEDRGPLGVRGRRLYRIQFDQDEGEPTAFEVPEDELEAGAKPEESWPRQAFDIKYVRHGNTNRWRSKTERGKMYREIIAKGAVVYSTARREGEKEGDEPFATVSVLLEVDPRIVDAHLPVHPEVWQFLTHEARITADEMFKSRHPGAVIEHVGD